MPSKTPKPLPIATITNNLGYDVDIYDVFDPKTNTASTQGLTKYTFLATVPDGASAQQVQTIHRTSALQAMRTGEITALNNNYYQQFPVAVLGVLPKSLGGPTDFTLTSDMQQGMEQSFEFIKYSQANPTSQLATDFRTAVGDQTNQTTAVNTFFQGTGSFQQCTLDTWTAVVGWQAQFTNPWQGKYYLYSTGSNSTGSTTGTADSTGTTGTTGSSSSGPTLVASLLITSSAAANTAVLTMADTGGQSTSVVMVGDGSMQEENPGTGPLSVSLTPVWLNVTQSRQVNGKTVSSYVIGAASTGTINGISVTGNLNKLALPSPSDSSSSASDKKLSFMKILSAIEGVAGLLITAGMLFYQIKSHKLAEKEKEHEALKDATSPADAKEKVAAVKADYQENEVPLQRAAAQKVDVAVQAVPEAYEQRDQAEKLEVQVDVVDKEVEKIGDDLRQSLGEGAANPEEEKITGELTNAKKNIKKELNGSESAAEDKAAAEKVKTDLNKASTNVDQTLKNEGNTLSQNEQKDLTSARDALNGEQDEANGLKQEQQEQNKENAEKASDKVDGDDLGNAKREDEGGDFKAPKIAE